MLNSYFSQQPGQIHLIIGPMFSGKTTELFRRLDYLSHSNKRTLLIKYAKDTRYSETQEACAHNSQKQTAISCTKLAELGLVYSDYEVIGIDEGQFFPDVVEMSEQMANQGKMVIISALNGTFQRKPFGSILELIPLSQHITKLSAACKVCFRAADFTQRIVESQDIELIGGSETYIPVCRECFNRGHESNLLQMKKRQSKTSTSPASSSSCSSGSSESPIPSP